MKVLVTVVAAPEPEIGVACLAVAQAGVVQQEGLAQPLAAIGLADHAAAAINVVPGVVLQLPGVGAVIVVHDGQGDHLARGNVVEIAVVHVEDHIGIARVLVGAASVTSFFMFADVPFWHRAATRRIIFLVEPEIIIAQLRIEVLSLAFRLPQGHPDAGCVLQRASQVVVGKAEDGPSGLVRDNAKVQRHVVRVLVQAVVDAPQRALLIGHRVMLSIVALPAQSHLSSPLEHGVILVRAIADSGTTVGLQAVVLQADPLGRGVVGEPGALVVLQVSRCELQEKRRARKGLPVEIGDAVHRRHPHVGAEPGLLQAGSVVDGVGVTVFGRPGLAVHSYADADPGDAGIAVVACRHGAHEVVVMGQVGFVPVARNDPIVIVVLITDDPGFGLDRREPRRHHVAAAIVAIVDCEGDPGWLAEGSLGLQPSINNVPAVFILVWLQVSPVENAITANNGIFGGVKVAPVVENVDARPGCAGQPPHRTRPICRRRNRRSVASPGGQDERTDHKQQDSRDHQGSERVSSPKR